jgi:hypothetical protein
VGTAASSSRTGAASPSVARFSNFTAWLSSPLYLSYLGQINVSGYASFHDYDCQPSYQCERNVFAELELRQGFGRYGAPGRQSY